MSLGSLLCCQHQLFVLVLRLDVPGDLKPQFRVFCLFCRRWKKALVYLKKRFLELDSLCPLNSYNNFPSICCSVGMSWGKGLFHFLHFMGLNDPPHNGHNVSVWAVLTWLSCQETSGSKAVRLGEVWLQWCLKITHLIKISQFRGFKNCLQNSCCLLFPFVFS